MHKFLAHRRGDDVGIATSHVGKGEDVVGVFMDDGTTMHVLARHDIPLGHKIALDAVGQGDDVREYGIRIGVAVDDLEPGDYVHTHNLKSARW